MLSCVSKAPPFELWTEQFYWILTSKVLIGGFCYEVNRNTMSDMAGSHPMDCCFPILPVTAHIAVDQPPPQRSLHSMSCSTQSTRLANLIL